MSKFVARHPTSREIYHVDKHCQRLKQEPMEKPERFIEWHNLEPCSWCEDTQ